MATRKHYVKVTITALVAYERGDFASLQAAGVVVKAIEETASKLRLIPGVTSIPKPQTAMVSVKAE